MDHTSSLHQELHAVMLHVHMYANIYLGRMNVNTAYFTIIQPLFPFGESVRRRLS